MYTFYTPPSEVSRIFFLASLLEDFHFPAPGTQQGHRRAASEQPGQQQVGHVRAVQLKLVAGAGGMGHSLKPDECGMTPDQAGQEFQPDEPDPGAKRTP